MKNFKQFLILSESFIRENDLVELYELNYKYDMMKKSPFNGVPDRRENIINSVERRGLVVSNHVITELIKIFDSWLGDHALTSAESWAKSRVKDMEDDDAGYFIADPSDDYQNYRVQKITSDGIESETERLLSKYFRYLVNNNKLMKCALTKWFNTMLSEHKDSYMTTLSSLDENDEDDVKEYKEFELRIKEIEEKRKEDERKRREQREKEERKQQERLREQLTIENRIREERQREESRKRREQEERERQAKAELENLLDKKHNWQEFQQVLQQNGITTLYHFTDRANIKSIKEHGGLYSWHYCDRKNKYLGNKRIRKILTGLK
jgi:flagellar biosynthesis GTPase FlhF